MEVSGEETLGEGMTYYVPYSYDTVLRDNIARDMGKLMFQDNAVMQAAADKIDDTDDEEADSKNFHALWSKTAYFMADAMMVARIKPGG